MVYACKSDVFSKGRILALLNNHQLLGEVQYEIVSKVLNTPKITFKNKLTSCFE